nr:MAG: hypothetical protein DIU57_17435 [Pseudomonadota bacterium]
MSYGLMPEGFVAKTLEEIRQELIDQLRARISPSLSFEADSILGHIVGIVSEYVARAWEQMQAVYRSMYPDSAVGDALDGIAAITGVTRLPATPSRVIATISGVPGTVLPAGRVASVEGTGARFRTVEEVTIPEVGSIRVEMVAEDTGPIPAPAGTLTQIDTPVVGWESVINLEDAILGRNRETDEELRARREATLRAVGSGTFESLRAALLLLPGVRQVSLFENTSMETDAAGLPPKSFEAVIQGGDDETIFREIWRRKPAGILAHGTEVGQVEDSHGFLHEVRFSRPVEVPIYISIKIRKGSAYPADGSDRIKAALVTYGQSLEIGQHVIAARLYPVIFSAAPGILDVPLLAIGTAPNPTDPDNITIAARELAIFASNRIEIVEV